MFISDKLRFSVIPSTGVIDVIRWCHWCCRVSDSGANCFSPLRDLRGSAKIFQIIGAGIRSSQAFHRVLTPDRCQSECRRNRQCTAFTFSFTDGCILFKESGLQLSLKGQVNEPVAGVVSGVAYCEGQFPRSAELNVFFRFNYC